ncbi:MAG: hypothetical protein ACR2RE_03400 [Geminicoccaceae bacterium]
MTPQEMLDSLDTWIKACREQRQGGRAKKLAAYRETLNALVNPVAIPEPPKPEWREKAKELGIPMFQRKKEDVIADIEAKELEIVKEIKPAIEGADAPDG